MAKDVTNYQCPACGGPLHFDEKLQKLKCDHCDSTYTTEEFDQLYEKKIQEAEENFNNENNDEWNISSMSSDWGEDAEKVRIYTCPSCGAQLIYDVTTAATSCPYCDNPNVIPGQFAGTLKPDYIIPFKLDKNAAIEALTQHYKGKFLLPKAFKEQHHIQELKGVYVPFWLYDGTVDGDCTFSATRSRVYRSGDYEITETDHYRVRRSGNVTFSQVPADGSSKMDDDYMDSIEPFDYRELKDFSVSYLPGYMADRYDVSAEENAERVGKRFRNSTITILRKDVHGYNTVTPIHTDTQIHQGKIRYALMPVWTLRTNWHGKDYMFMMNGQTGKMVGDLPVNGKKLALTSVGVFAVSSVLFKVIGVGGFLASLIGSFFM